MSEKTEFFAWMQVIGDRLITFNQELNDALGAPPTDIDDVLMALGERVTAVSQDGKPTVPLIDWLSMQVLPQPEGGRPYMFDARVELLDRSTNLDSVPCASCCMGKLISIVGVPWTPQSQRPCGVAIFWIPEGFHTIEGGQ